MSIAKEKYVSFTTFRKDGTPKSLPVWIVDTGEGTVGFTTDNNSWKVKRLANNPEVRIQASDSRGRAKEGSEEIKGAAEVVTGAEADRIQDLIKGKYGLQVPLTSAMYKVMALIKRSDPVSPAAIIITPNAAD